MTLESAALEDDEPTGGRPSVRPSRPITGPILLGGDGFWLREAIELRFSGYGGASCTLGRMSATTLWFDTLDDDRLPPQDTRIDAWIVAPDNKLIGPLPGEICAHQSLRPFRLELREATFAVARDFLQFLREAPRFTASRSSRTSREVDETISDPNRIRAILGLLAARRVAPSNGGATLTSVEGDRLIWVGDAYELTRGEAVELEGYNSIFHVPIAEAQLTDDGVTTALPTSLRRARSRHFRRGAPKQRLSLRYEHPIWTGVRITSHAIADISFGGIRFLTTLEALLFEGLELPLVELTVPGERSPIRFHADVRRLEMKDDVIACGLRMKPSSPHDESRWAKLVGEELYGEVPAAENIDELWDLFDVSGYFKLSGKDPEQFAEIKRGFATASRRTAAAPQLFGQATFRSERGLEAAISILKPYRQTWFGHQLAKRPGNPPGMSDPRHVLREVYVRTMEHPLRDPSFKWLMGLIEAGVPWMRRAHIDFALKHRTSGLTTVQQFRMVEVDCTEPRWASIDGITIERATTEELGLLSQVVWGTRSRPYVEALDLVPERIELGDIAEAWRSAGFDRDRAILIARDHGMPVAAAILETGQAGTNLFRLLDSARIFDLGGDRFDVSRAALMHYARIWYAERGRAKFLYLREDQPDQAPEHGDLGEGFLWIMSATLLPDFLEHVFEMTGPRGASQI
jgi:hypothetical protein